MIGKKNKKKIILGNQQQCFSNCNETENNKYDYGNICYQQCPNGTIFNNDSNICELRNISSEKNDITEKYNYISYIIDSLKTINIYESDYFFNNHTLYLFSSTNINYDQKELFYDFSTSFINFSNIELFSQMKNYIKDYSLSDKKNIIVKGESDFIYQLTTIDQEKKLINNNITEKDYNISIIDLTECEQLLKKEYNIDKNISLIIMKMEKLTNKTANKNIQYQIYEPINLTMLNTSICYDSEIKIYIPYSLKGETSSLFNDLKNNGYNLFDKNDKFYNDICTPYTGHTGTDVPLSARQKYIYTEHGNLCQDNCQFLNYSIYTELISCSCKFNNEGIEPNKEEKFNPKIIYKSFYDILKYSNYKVLKCSNLVFKNKTFISNKGSIIVIVYFSIYLSFLIMFIIKGISPLKNVCSKIEGNPSIYLNEIKPANNILKSINLINVNEKNNNISKRSGKKRVIKIIKKVKKKKPKINNNNPMKKNSKINMNIQNDKRNKKEHLENKINNGNHFQSSFRNILELKQNNEKNISVYIPKLNEIIDKDDINENIDNNDLSNYELNNLEYENSIKLDNRKFYEIYWSILKREHLILFTFFSFNDYNLLSIKFARFIFLACTDMALNVFFFSDDSMNTIFLTYGKYDFIQKIPQMIYTVMVSQLLEVLLCFLSLTDKYIYQIKKSKNQNLLNINKIFRIIKIKLFFFFIITFAFLIFYWYIISAFCAVYINTQIIFIKDSIFSFIMGLIYPFILYLFPSGLRVICLKHKKINLKFLYTLSDIIPIF